MFPLFVVFNNHTLLLTYIHFNSLHYSGGLGYVWVCEHGEIANAFLNQIVAQLLIPE